MTQAKTKQRPRHCAYLLILWFERIAESGCSRESCLFECRLRGALRTRNDA